MSKYKAFKVAFIFWVLTYCMWIVYATSKLLNCYCCDKTPWPKTTGEEGGLIHPPLQITPQHWGKSGQQHRESWCRDLRGLLLPGSLPKACSACSLLTPRTSRQGGAPSTKSWALPPPINYQSRKGSTSQSGVDIFSTEVSSSLIN